MFEISRILALCGIDSLDRWLRNSAYQAKFLTFQETNYVGTLHLNKNTIKSKRAKNKESQISYATCQTYVSHQVNNKKSSSVSYISQ
jgi:hypothetical protein